MPHGRVSPKLLLKNSLYACSVSTGRRPLAKQVARVVTRGNDAALAASFICRYYIIFESRMTRKAQKSLKSGSRSRLSSILLEFTHFLSDEVRFTPTIKG